MNNFCFPDPRDPNLHYTITAGDHERWSNAIAANKATVYNPPMKLFSFWTVERGAINRESRMPIKQSTAQQTKSSLECLESMQQKMQERLMEAKLMDQMDSLEDKRDRREE